MIKEINEIINNLEQTLGWCDRITTGNLPHKIGNLKQCLVSTIELLKVLNIGWHPASELPKLKDGEDDVDSIVILDGYGIKLPFHATYCRFTGWSHNNVKWWCYPPNEE